jgi:PAS domain S-box-containing protein
MGCRLEGIIGNHLFDITSNLEEAKQLIADDLEVMHSGKQQLIPERTITDQKGQKHIFQTFKTPFQMPNTKQDAVLGVAIDITEIKRAEESFRKSELKYRELVQNANSLILRMDREARITFFNEYAQDFFGFSEEELLGKSVVGTIVPETDTNGVELEPIMRELCLNPEKYSRNENENICKDGKRVWIEWINRGIYTKDGESVGVLSIGNDVTQLRQLQQQLIQSQKMESIGRLAGGIAHDFNNLLTIIVGYSDSLLHELELDDMSHSELEEIKHAGERAAMLTKQLLAFSRKQVMIPEVLDICTVITQMEKMLCRLIGEDIEFRTSFSEEVIYVEADQSQLEQVIMNLVVNARDAMPNGGAISITVKTVTIEEEYNDFSVQMKKGKYVQINVIDTGTGIDDDKLNLIFEPFYTTKEEGKGTGLGLSTVYGIIKQSGGYIYASSEVGKGTTISIYLTKCTSEDFISDQPDSCLLELNGHETILLAEDDEAVRNFIAQILQFYGYTVLAVESGMDALDTASSYQNEIDLLITDMVMPVMTGKELAIELLQSRQNVKVLITSGYTREKIIYEDLHEQGFHFLQKPIAQDTLLQTVRSILNG